MQTSRRPRRAAMMVLLLLLAVIALLLALPIVFSMIGFERRGGALLGARAVRSAAEKQSEEDAWGALSRDFSPAAADAALRGQVSADEPLVMVATPMRACAKYIDRYFANLERLDYPRHRLSIAVLESDPPAGDRTAAL